MIASPDTDIILKAGQQITAPLSTPQNYAIQSSMASIANYTRWGNDLVVQFSSGEQLRINNFFMNGSNFHKLMLIDNGTRIEIDFSKALTNISDGIDNGMVQYAQVSESLSVKTLLGILSNVAVGAGGLYLTYGNNGSSDKDPNLLSNTKNPPNSPEADIVNDDKDPKEIVRNGGSTNDNTPTLEGEGGVPGGTVSITVNNHHPVYVTIGSDGKWSYTFPKLNDGDYTIILTQTDQNGLKSQETHIEFTVDTVAPDVPNLESVNDNVDLEGIIENGGITNDPTPEFKGKAEPNSTITIYADGEKVAATKTDKDGNWSIELLKNLKDGEHKFQITATDAAGNESAKSDVFVLTVDTTPPAPLSDNTIYWGAADGGELTAFTADTPIYTTIRKLALKGIANAAGDKYDAKWIEIYDNGVSIGKVEISIDGTWRFAPDINFGLGSHNFSFEAIDAAGNRSSRANVAQFIISAPSETIRDATLTSAYTADFIDIDNNQANEQSKIRSAKYTQDDTHYPLLSYNIDNNTLAEDSHLDTGNIFDEPHNNNAIANYSYKIGNFIDGSDAIINTKSEPINVKNNDDTILTDKEPTINIINEIIANNDSDGYKTNKNNDISINTILNGNNPQIDNASNSEQPSHNHFNKLSIFDSYDEYSLSYT